MLQYLPINKNNTISITFKTKIFSFPGKECISKSYFKRLYSNFSNSFKKLDGTEIITPAKRVLLVGRFEDPRGRYNTEN